jgi:hypothetical protein
VKGETNNLLTPSGYFMFEDNARFGVTVTRPDFNERQIGTEHLQELVKDDTTVKEMHDRSAAVLQFTFGKNYDLDHRHSARHAIRGLQGFASPASAAAALPHV